MNFTHGDPRLEVAKVAAWWESDDSSLRKPPAHSWCYPLTLAGVYGVLFNPREHIPVQCQSLPSKTLRAGVLRCGRLQNSTKNRFCARFFAPHISSRSIISSFISPTINTRHLIGVSTSRGTPQTRSAQSNTSRGERERLSQPTNYNTQGKKNNYFPTSTH